ncbi:Sensor protein kinase WalK [Pedobacter sp. Bi27]|uniref:sensor histidine kinase n=1 Tax=unclassified Pedobacter TaxID=2628915 RepID=UPI001E02A32E|nr:MULTISPECIES: HAMP domain-containing sensor histidine kinase [unclassified Pedobacter]CAH0297831.1 Sensor protein kinase WalK [Pedobacter sp. Bi27]CAH0303829.1 Sensor protein kinase WalK [Pedobacter sp. Bi36]CAH0313024.1 Sensor protein kinase WalK [Pedobacter sp. Bi126]
MKDRIYKSVVLVSFLILLLVQLRLTYNSYVLRDRDYSLKEKTLINDEYGRSISEDKVYKGGGKIIDSILSRNMPALKQAYLSNKKEFVKRSQSISNTLLKDLRKESTMDSVFRSIVKRNGLDSNLQYLLTFQSIEINFDTNIGDITVFDTSTDTLFKAGQKTPFGVIIDGTLTNPSVQNRVTNLSVSGKLVYDYRVTFNLFVDPPGRTLKVAYQMLPTFLLVALCIIIIVGINYYTYISWMRQKKETDVKSDFLNSIKHEFNTPITTILVASKSLHEDEVLNDRTRVNALVNIVERQARRLHSHINQMLEISEINSNINLEETDLNYAILTLVNDYKIKVQEPNSLTFDPHGSEIMIMIDPFVFTTMLQNILDNSFKHNHSDIKMTVLFITEHIDGYTIHIKDNGKGIEDAMKEKIFDKFFRAGKDNTVSGLGLGLYYVKQCIDIHSWEINVRTTLGKGTEFLIHIPKEQTLISTNH